MFYPPTFLHSATQRSASSHQPLPALQEIRLIQTQPPQRAVHHLQCSHRIAETPLLQNGPCSRDALVRWVGFFESLEKLPRRGSQAKVSERSNRSQAQWNAGRLRQGRNCPHQQLVCQGQIVALEGQHSCGKGLTGILGCGEGSADPLLQYDQ